MAFEEIKRLKDRLHDENVVLREQIDQAFMFEEIVGSSPALKNGALQHRESGSHKLYGADYGRNRHREGTDCTRHTQGFATCHPGFFISVNCASIPPSLIASELFGHEKGAFNRRFATAPGPL